MQGQSQLAHNSISILKRFNKDFSYKRIDLDFDQNFNVAMDETCPHKLNKLAEKASRIFQYEGKEVLNSFFSK